MLWGNIITASVLLLTFNCIPCESDEDVYVDVPGQGRLRGFRRQMDESTNVLFFGRIPFAEPPVGNYRFARPGPPPSWEGDRNSTYYGPACPQTFAYLFDLVPRIEIEKMFSEDCLYMNVYVPEKINSTSVEKYPVLLFVQGGGFYAGSAMLLYSGEVLSTYNDVIVVTFNYRLQALGYLTTQDEVAPGNWGMWDQVAALKWVKENIVHFHGDPDAITIYGQSAGAVSVGLHMLSPQSTGLFHQVIAQSGSAHVNWAVKLPPYDPMDSTIELATRMDCPTSSSTEIIDCLRTKNPFDIVASAFSIMDYDQLGFMVVVDGPDNFLPDDPYSIMERGEYQKLPYMTGYTKSESATSAMFGIEDPDSGITREEFREKIMSLVTARKYDNCSEVVHEDIARAMEFYYLPWEAPRDKIRLRDQYIKLESDESFVAGVHYSAQTMLSDEENPKYVYRFDYESASASYDDYVEVPHLEDLYFCFGRPYKRSLVDVLPVPRFLNSLERNWTDTDEVMADVSMALWTNFVKYGNPTPEGHNIPGVDGTWDKYEAGNKGVFHINTQSEMSHDFDFHDVGYWYDYDGKVVASASNQCCDCQDPTVSTGHALIKDMFSLCLCIFLSLRIML